MKTVTLLAIKGCLASTVANMVDALAIANRWHRHLIQTDADLFATRVVSVDGAPVTASGMLQIAADAAIGEAPAGDYLVIPALLPVPKEKGLYESRLLDFIRRQHDRGTQVASLCTGAFLLAETGLLDGRPATTNWQFERQFRVRYPRVDLRIGEMLTECDGLICSGAVSALMHLVLRIVQREGSSQLATACAKAMLVDPNSTSQAPYLLYPLPSARRDALIARAESYLQGNLSGAISIDQVAGQVGLSPRHFKRRFKQATGDSPLAYLQKLRIQKAKELLEQTRESVDEITRRGGYEDGSAFCRLFKRHTSLSPREYRERFFMRERG